jgi:hypothetical protein
MPRSYGTQSEGSFHRELVPKVVSLLLYRLLAFIKSETSSHLIRNFNINKPRFIDEMNKARTKKYAPSQDETYPNQRNHDPSEFKDRGPSSRQHDPTHDAQLSKHSFALTNQTKILPASKNFQKPFRRAAGSSCPRTRSANLSNLSQALR